jgi:alkanesulfonate monooxygenase SsuD/methylene tetrahydromethanopterin reductase-like flavin-dependent oxidoreductase (luciferase family)
MAAPHSKGKDQGLAHPRGGQTSLLNDPEKCNEIAADMATGMSNPDLAEKYEVTKRTVMRWRRDPRVRGPLHKYTEDRIMSITRRVDSKIESILDNSDLTVQELILIRKEFLGGALRTQAETSTADDPETVAAAMQALEENPGFMEEMERLISSQPDEEDEPSETPSGSSPAI